MYMFEIKFDDESKYIDIIKELIKDFDSYSFISNQIDNILNVIQNDIESVIFNDDDKIYRKLHIKLYDTNNYAFNYDGKNFPLLSFYCKEITINDCDTIINIDDNLVIDVFSIRFENFVKLD